MNRFFTLLFIIAAVSLPALASAKGPIQIYEGTVIKVSDGDTINVESNGTKLKVRFYGIDAPETTKVNKRTGMVSKAGQPYGEDAMRALAGKVARQRVRLEVMDIDRYRRLVSVVWIGNRNINREMVTEGWAWAYRQYLDRPYASEYISAEEQARARRLGLWNQGNPQPPWEFRKQQRMQGE